MLGIHDPEPLDVGQPELVDALLRLAQHGLGDIDAANTVAARIVGKRYAGPDSHLEDAPTDAFGGRDRGMSPALENSAEHEVIDGCPSRIRLGDGVLVEFRMLQVSHGILSSFCRTPGTREFVLFYFEASTRRAVGALPSRPNPGLSVFA